MGWRRRNELITRNRVTVGIVNHQQRPQPTPISESLCVKHRINGDLPAGPWYGFGQNHNLLMEEANSDWYVALNPDVQVEPAQIIRIVDEAEVAGYSICSPILRSPWGLSGLPQREFPGAGVWFRETVRGADQYPGPHGPVVPSAWVSGACIAIRLSTGLRFDEEFFMYFEDVDLCRRAWLAGMKVGVATAVQVSHLSGWSSTDPLLLNRGVQYARSATLFARRRDQSRLLMRAAGIARAFSRTCLPRRTESERAASRALLYGFCRMHRADGIEELAERHNSRVL